MHKRLLNQLSGNCKCYIFQVHPLVDQTEPDFQLCLWIMDWIGSWRIVNVSVTTLPDTLRFSLNKNRLKEQKSCFLNFTSFSYSFALATQQFLLTPHSIQLFTTNSKNFLLGEFSFTSCLFLINVMKRKREED